MRLWQRIYIFTIILFVITLGIAGVLFIEKSFAESLSREITRCYSEQSTINSGVGSSLPAFSTLEKFMGNENLNSRILHKFASDYVNKTDGIYLEILDIDNNEVYSDLNMKMNYKREELEFGNKGERRRIIRDVGDKTYIFISNLIQVNRKFYKLTYARDISNVYAQRVVAYEYFIKIGLIMLVVFSIFMFFITKIISSPISHMMKVTKKITDGDYDARIEFESKDELGILADNFNFMAESISKNIDELEKNNMQKKQFIESFTHELKTPLTAIIGFSNLLKTTKIDDKTFMEALEFIYSEGKRLEELSRDLMNLVVLDKNDFNMKKESFGDVLEDAKKSVKLKLDEKDIQLILEYKDAFMDMEINLIRLLISNLIDNAIKASSKGSKIIISLKTGVGSIVLCIKDFGIGIPSSHLEHILEPFYMVDKARTRKNNGAGLGLSIAKKIVDVHGGIINISSEENIGTKICITFGVKGVTKYD